MTTLQGQIVRRMNALGIASLVLISLAPRANAADDPIHICMAQIDKPWYFAIGSDVFKIPFGEFSDRTGEPLINNVDQKFALSPPNPDVPIGCHDNPQQLRSFSVLNWPVLEPAQYRGALPDRIYLLEMARYPNGTPNDPETDPVIEDMTQTAVICQSTKLIRRWPDGTILCTDKDGQLNTLLNQGEFKFSTRWEYIISGNKYLTPMGQNLTMHENLNWVDVSYLLTNNILIHYEWNPPITAANIDSAYLISVDKLFQAKLSTYRVFNYFWPQKTAK